MKIKHWNSMMRFVLMAAILTSPISLGGCELYDWLVTELQTALSPISSYRVSVVDCKVISAPRSLMKQESQLSKRLSSSIRQGIDDLGKMQKFKNVKRVDAIPVSSVKLFHDDFFANAKSYDERTAILRDYCDQFDTDIIMWSATTGDDFEIALASYLYRRDLDAVSTTEPMRLSEHTSERVQENMVRKASMDLLQRSLEENPVGGNHEVVKALRENKEIILSLGAILMTYLAETGEM